MHECLNFRGKKFVRHNSKKIAKMTLFVSRDIHPFLLLWNMINGFDIWSLPRLCAASDSTRLVNPQEIISFHDQNFSYLSCCISFRSFSDNGLLALGKERERERERERDRRGASKGCISYARLEKPFSQILCL